MKSTTLKLIVTVLSSVIIGGNALANVNKNLTVSSGYPYQDLVQRFDEVRIRYSDTDALDQIVCSVELTLNQEEYESVTSTVSTRDFESAPLKTCISRKQAKSFLAMTF